MDKRAILFIIILLYMSCVFAGNKINITSQKDSSFDEDADRVGTENLLYVQEINTTSRNGEVPWMYFNFTNISGYPNIEITNANLWFSLVSGSAGSYITIYDSNTRNWSEATPDDICNVTQPAYYCHTMDSYMNTKLFGATLSSGTINYTALNLTNRINYRLGNGGITIILNATRGLNGKQYDFGSSENGLEKQRPHLQLRYNNITSNKNFTKFSYPNYNFKINKRSGEIANLTVGGRSGPVSRNLTWTFINSTGGKYDRFNANISVYYNTSLYDMILVNYNIGMNGIKYGVCNETIELFENNYTMYNSVYCKATSRITDIYRVWHDTKLYNTGLCTMNNGSNYKEYNLTASGLTRYNKTSVNTGTNSKSAWMISCNNTNGRIIIGTSRERINGDAGWTGQNEMNSAQWFTADTNDSMEHQNQVTADYNVTNPNISMVLFDTAAITIRRDVNYNGRAGFTNTNTVTYKLRPIIKVAGIDVAQDFIRGYVMIDIQNDSTAYQSKMTSLNSDSRAASDEFSTIGTRFFPFLGTLFGPSSNGQADYVFKWQTQNHLKRDVDKTSNIGMQQLLSHCYETLREKKEGNGWWAYDDTRWTQYYSSEQDFGNSYDRMWPCYWVLARSWINNYPGTKNDILFKWANYSNNLKLNTQEPIGRRNTIIAKVNNGGIEINLTKREVNPLFRSNTAIPASNVRGPYFIACPSGSGDSSCAIYRIDCNSTNGTRLWFDNMSTDNSTNYNVTGFTYNAALRSFRTLTTGFIEPKNSKGNWVNYTCAIDFEVLTNTTGSAGYTQIFFRGNRTLNPTTYSTHSVYFRFYHHIALSTPTSVSPNSIPYSSFYYRWMINNQSAGLFTNLWAIPNASAVLPRSNPAQVGFRADSSDQILNQMGYMLVGLADATRNADASGNKAIHQSNQKNLNSTIDGINHYFKTTICQRPEGFICYSLGNYNHDSNYLGLWIYELGKITQAAEGKKINDIPLTCYYLLHGRGNSSEGLATTSTGTYTSAFAETDSRCSQFVDNRTDFTQTLASDDYVQQLYYDEVNTSIRFVNSNCSTVFNHRIPIYYKNNHIMLNASRPYAKKTCTNIRIVDVKNATIQDAYQINGTSNTYITLSPIPLPTHTWYMYYWSAGNPFGSTDNESYPRGLVTSPDATYWNREKHIWDNNHTVYKTASFEFMNASTVSILLLEANNTTPYAAKVGATVKSYGTTNSAGALAFPSFAVSSGETVIIAQESYTAPIVLPSTASENVANVCSLSYTSFILLGVAIFIVVAVGMITLISMGVVDVVTLPVLILSMVIILLIGLVMTNALCNVF
jgi:hypothetical protein